MGTLVILEHSGYCFGDFFDGYWDLWLFVSIIASSKATSGASAWSCADNAN